MAFIGEKYSREGKLPLTMVTSNPQFMHAKLPNWIITRIGRQSLQGGAKYDKNIAGISRSSSRKRITISMKYVPPRESRDAAPQIGAGGQPCPLNGSSHSPVPESRRGNAEAAKLQESARNDHF